MVRWAPELHLTPGIRNHYPPSEDRRWISSPRLVCQRHYINWHTIYKGTIYKLVHWYTCIQSTAYKLVHWYTCIHEYKEMHTPSNSDPLPFTEECAIKIQNKCSFALLFPFPRVGSLFFAKKLCKDKLPQYLQVVPRHKVYSLEPTLSALMCNIFVVRVTFCAIRPLAYLLQSFSKNSRRYYTVFESSYIYYWNRNWCTFLWTVFVYRYHKVLRI